MTFNNPTLANELYPISNGTTSSSPFVVQFQPRDPTVNDIQYRIQKTWLNTNTNQFWFLKSFISNSGITLANWIPFSGFSTVETVTGDDGVVVNPVANNLNFLGNAVANATHAKPIFFRSGGDPNEELDVQVSNAVGSSNINNAGISSFNNAQFTVDANGFVTIIGGTAPIEKTQVDAFTGPGTNPVVPDGTGKITVTGGQVAAGTTANVIRTDSLAANTYTIEVQRSQAVGSSTVGDNGVSHFDNTQFTVDSNGFVRIIGGLGFSSIAYQVFTTSGTYTPTSGMAYCVVQCLAGGGAGGGANATAADSLSSGGGGGAGEYAVSVFSASSIGVSQVVTIGAGGTGVSAGTGNTGGTTSLGVLITALGGLGGDASTASSSSGGANGGAGGTGGTGGNYRAPGAKGDYSWSSSTGAGVGIVASGSGAASQLGQQGTGTFLGNTGTVVGSAASGYGAGGSGAINSFSNSASTGGTGSSGILIVQEFIIA